MTSQRQKTLDELLQVACWEVIFGAGPTKPLLAKIDALLNAGAVWHGRT